jgi:hypothetical protein
MYEVDLITRFTEGDCHILAKTLDEISDEWHLAATMGQDHAFVVDEYHEYALDIEGLQSLPELLDRWGYKEEEWQLQDWNTFINTKDWIEEGEFKNSYKIAKKIAPKILQGEAVE